MKRFFPCGHERSEENSYKRGLSGVRCKKCACRRARARYAKNPKAIAQQNRLWASHNQSSVALSRRKANWKTQGIVFSLQEYDKLLAEQKGLCAICKEGMPEDKVACVDHDHKTKKVRGLTHRGCNILLGLAHESSFKLHRAAEYLEKHNGR